MNPRRNKCLAELFKVREDLDPNKAKAVVRRFAPELADEFFMEGVEAALNDWAATQPVTRTLEQERRLHSGRRQRERRQAEEAAARNGRIAAIMADVTATHRKAEAFDHIVEFLDKMKIGGVALGDCTKDKLTAEAARLNGAAEGAKKQASTYLAIASHLKASETVRASTARPLIIEILRGLVE